MRYGRLSFQYENPLRKRFTDDFFHAIPRSPGIYLMRDSRGTILYIGKAKDLRARISSYRQLKPGKSPERLLEMIEDVARIVWEPMPSESAALLFEKELLHAIRPPFNITDTEEEHYLFIGTRILEGRAHFRLTSRPQEPGYALYGCYKHRRKTKSGYNALLRLLYASAYRGTRFSIPAKISRVTPAYNYSVTLPEAWREPLHQFLRGGSARLLHLILERMLENDAIPPFMYPSLQEDLEITREFFSARAACDTRSAAKYAIDEPLLSQSMMDELIARDFTVSLEVPDTRQAS